MARKITNKLLEMVEEGVLDPMDLITACLKYMSETEVADMAAVNEFIPEEEDDQEDLVDLYEQSVGDDDDDEEEEEDEDED